MLRVLNSQSRQKEDFKPIDPAGKDVRMYVCGPTVYDSLHLGHARAAITPDIVRRYLAYKGYTVRFVSNFTDIDDKIIRRANAEKRDWKELTEYHIAEFHAMMKTLNVLPATLYPKATEHIPEMIEIVNVLIAKNHAYVAADGDVYFDTTTYARYGNLSGRVIEEDDAGHSQRISDERMKVKKHPGDFVLWKLAKPGEPFWESPWGKGRPGWHLECSAMSRKHLGVPFDIHGGGQDLLFPHHEDEKAQTECAYCEELKNGESVNYWVHNGFLTLNNEKMSKSLGNVKWLREMVWPEGPHDPMAVRMIFLSAHYRAPINFEPGLFDEASARLDRIYNAIEAIDRANFAAATPVNTSEKSATITAFETAMDDDFNTAGALAAVFDLVSIINKELTSKAPNAELLHTARRDLITVLNTLGIRSERASKPSASDGGDSLKLVDLLLQVRQDVRAAKLWPVSDKIRNGLKDLGYEVEDLPGGKWTVKKK
ncbi:MAG: cysteine--tRNA ligase [Planctomycetota bacterium]